MPQISIVTANTRIAYPIGKRRPYLTLGIDVLGPVIKVARKMLLDTLLEKDVFADAGNEEYALPAFSAGFSRGFGYWDTFGTSGGPVSRLVPSTSFA
jgi:hypothetical protein